MIAEAIEMHLEIMQQQGEPIPPPATETSFAVDETSDEEFCTWVEVESPATAPS